MDGLDEWPRNEQEEIIEDLMKIKGPSPGVCKILLSSRAVSPISKLLEGKPRICLEDYPEMVNAAIAAFVRPRLDTLRQRFSASIVDELGTKILGKARGKSLATVLNLSDRMVKECFSGFDLFSTPWKIYTTSMRCETQ